MPHGFHRISLNPEDRIPLRLALGGGVKINELKLQNVQLEPWSSTRLDALQTLWISEIDGIELSTRDLRTMLSMSTGLQSLRLTHECSFSGGLSAVTFDEAVGRLVWDGVHGLLPSTFQYHPWTQVVRGSIERDGTVT